MEPALIREIKLAQTFWLFFKGKVDSYVEQVTKKLANYLGDVLEDQRERLLENLVANGMDLATYLTRFQWDMAKYPIRQSLKNLTDIIGKKVFFIKAELQLLHILLSKPFHWILTKFGRSSYCIKYILSALL